MAVGKSVVNDCPTILRTSFSGKNGCKSGKNLNERRTEKGGRRRVLSLVTQAAHDFTR